MGNRSLKVCFLLGTSMLLVMFFSVVSTMAQATTGSIRGTVVDKNGGAIAGANVTIKNENTGSEVTAITNSDGVFEV
jgi:hypothetical protein